MSAGTVYQALAALIAYPVDQQVLQTSHAQVAQYLAEHSLPLPTAPLGAVIQTATLAELQEQYVALFDFNAALAPYLGHHLYGDNQKKGSYMIGLKQAFSKHGYQPPSNELPDHLEVLLGFLSQLPNKERPAFVREQMLAGLGKLKQSFASRPECPWAFAIEATATICAADCGEIVSCSTP